MTVVDIVRSTHRQFNSNAIVCTISQRWIQQYFQKFIVPTFPKDVAFLGILVGSGKKIHFPVVSVPLALILQNRRQKFFVARTSPNTRCMCVCFFLTFRVCMYCSTHTLHNHAIVRLSQFISVREPNIRYLGLEAMARLAKIPGTLGNIKRHLVRSLCSVAREWRKWKCAHELCSALRGCVGEGS